jgi:uncharacterized membrane protein YphA (DoxX/SURF4 family)
MSVERVDGPAPAATTLRIVLAFLGAAGLIAGSFLAWFRVGGLLGQALAATGQKLPTGIEIPFKAYYSVTPGGPSGDVSFFTSAGILTIVAGVLVLIGILVPWLARLGGVIGLLAVVLFVITLYRAPTEPTTGLNLGIGNLGLGMWIILIGSLLALVAGFVRGERTVVTATSAPPPPPPPA